MKVMFVSPECAPFAASGGLGDVLGALPRAITLQNLQAEVSVIMPYYDVIRKKYGADIKKKCDISFYLSWRSTGASIYEMNKDGVIYFFIENHRYFDRGRLYGEYDDGERFAFFSKAVIEFILQSTYKPDVLHANDWQSALSIIYLKTAYKSYPFLYSIRTLYTVHNIEYQGKFSREILWDVFGIEERYSDILEYNGDINLTKGALTVADYITTVSPNYKDELRHDFFAFGLAPIISLISHKMCGIINGIDYNTFSPNDDSDIYFPYDVSNLDEGKSKNKLALQEELGLSVNEKAPLIIMITRLTDGKGIDLVLHVLEEILTSLNVQVAVLGTGDKKYEDSLSELSKKYGNLSSNIKFDRKLSKKMYAGADIFLMPSKSEPCGLAQMIACSYGTVPIVRSVGGLYDSIKGWNGKEGNGFRFDNYNAHELFYTLKNALSVYNSESWGKLRYNAMTSKFEWSDSAKKYIEIYNNLLNW